MNNQKIIQVTFLRKCLIIMELEVFLGAIGAIATLICAVLGAILHRKTERIKIMEGQLSEKRYLAYAKLYDFFYEMFKNSTDGKKLNNKELRNKLLDAKKELIMYGTDDVVFALNHYLTSLSDENTYHQLDFFLDIMLLIRKDMCGRTKVARDDIMLSLLQDQSEFEKFKRMKENNFIV